MRYHPLFANNGWTGLPIIMTDKVQESIATSERVFPISSGKILKRETFEATREAQDIVSQAQEKAKQIIEEAERERESIYQRAEEEGRSLGLAAWNETLTRASQRADQLTKTWEQNMLRLSIRVAEKIIGEELRLRPEATVDILKRVLEGVRPGKMLTIQVNAADAPQVRAHLDRIKDAAGIRSEIEIAISANISSGGCVLESELGIIDARLETQLQCLEEALVRDLTGA